ncbi:MAG: hypothetical protein JWR58_5668 [Pseudonocardia sp.]|nr:hypothetical protein [Pseudonocardia sp.]
MHPGPVPQAAGNIDNRASANASFAGVGRPCENGLS